MNEAGDKHMHLMSNRWVRTMWDYNFLSEYWTQDTMTKLDRRFYSISGHQSGKSDITILGKLFSTYFFLYKR